MNISIVIPVYNEENRIHLAFDAVKKLRLPRDFKLNEVIFVNDGSTDNTLKQLKRFKKDSNLPIEIISYTKNRGKGFAVRKGMLASTGDYSLLSDADMSTPFSEFSKLVPSIEKKIDIIIGTRKNGKSTVTIHQTKLRENLGKSFTLFTKIALQMDVTDFTCGFKLFSKKAMNSIFPEARIDRWGYDAELLFIAKKKDISVSECPVTWADVKDSHVNVTRAVFGTMGEIAKILYYHNAPQTRVLKTGNFLYSQALKVLL